MKEKTTDKDNQRWNFLVFITDQQNFRTLGCNGNQMIRTPNLDKMAGEGVNFINNFTPIPICGPARASVLTGLYPSAHGVIHWGRDGH